MKKMKIEEFLKTASSTVDFYKSFVENIRELPKIYTTVRYLYGVKAPRGTVAALISARDSGSMIGLMVGKTMSGRIIAGPCRMAAGEALAWAIPVSEYCSREHAPKLFSDDTWCVVGLEKKKKASAWLQGEEFAGLTFIKLEV
jgi:hypothetical protein